MLRNRGSARFESEEAEDGEEAEDAGAEEDRASARGDERKLLSVGTSTAARVTASDTRLTMRRCDRDPRRAMAPSVRRR